VLDYPGCHGKEAIKRVSVFPGEIKLASCSLIFFDYLYQRKAFWFPAVLSNDQQHQSTEDTQSTNPHHRRPLNDLTFLHSPTDLWGQRHLCQLSCYFIRS